MNILQGVKLRWDLSICRGESGGEGLRSDTGAVVTKFVSGWRGHVHVRWKSGVIKKGRYYIFGYL